jgi:hypothetical protein
MAMCWRWVPTSTRRWTRLRADLPIGIEYSKVSDQPRIVKTAVGLFMRSLGEAIAIVLAVSFLSLGLRAGAVVALTIPLVLAATFLGMAYFGIDLHRISTGALIIALGLLVDDAMIAVEMMARKIDEGYDRFRAATFAYSSTAFPMLTGTLITASGFLPIATAKSTTGEYTFAIFAVVTLALLISWVIAVGATPFIGMYVLKDRSRRAPRGVRLAFLSRPARAHRRVHAPPLAHDRGHAGRVRAGSGRHEGHREAVLPQFQPGRDPDRDVAARRRELSGHRTARPSASRRSSPRIRMSLRSSAMSATVRRATTCRSTSSCSGQLRAVRRSSPRTSPGATARWRGCARRSTASFPASGRAPSAPRSARRSPTRCSSA